MLHSVNGRAGGKKGTAREVVYQTTCLQTWLTASEGREIYIAYYIPNSEIAVHEVTQTSNRCPEAVLE
jgi:hypothetical protein